MCADYSMKIQISAKITTDLWYISRVIYVDTLKSPVGHHSLAEPVIISISSVIYNKSQLVLDYRHVAHLGFPSASTHSKA